MQSGQVMAYSPGMLVYVNRTFYESNKVVDITGDNDNEAERVVKILSIHSVSNRLLSIFYF